LDTTPGDLRERDGGTAIKPEDTRAVDDESASRGRSEVTITHSAARQAGENLSLRRGELGLLKTDDVGTTDKVLDSTPHPSLTGISSPSARIVGETTNVVGHDGGDAGLRGEKGEGTQRLSCQGLSLAPGPALLS
jgi:hypothetical protein